MRARLVAAGEGGGADAIEHALAVDLLRSADGGVAGLTLHVLGEGQHDGVGAVHCRAVVLASGGLGQVFSQSTNPSVSTGDGMALALRAGARLRDLEFVQFHPTVLARSSLLLSEALRGEGAHLLDGAGERFIDELAPRDVVARAVGARDTAVLDLRPVPQDRFRTLMGRIEAEGYHPATDPVPGSVASPESR